MGKRQTTIEINGKLYDARTGHLLRPGGSSPVPVAKTATTVRRALQDVRRAGTSIPARRVQERSKTLMRQAVKRPVAATPRPKAVRPVTDVAAPVRPAGKRPGPRPTSVDPARQARAAEVKRSKLVSRFNLNTQPPKAAARPSASAKVKPATAAAANVRPVPKSAPQRPSAIQTMLDNGLRAAQSHTEPAKKAPRKRSAGKRRLTGLAAAGLSVLLLGAFIAYQNIPNIAIRYAATRAGINASLPGWRPAGFALDHHIQYTPGQITVSFQSNADERSFSITQRQSNWNSETLRDNYVASTDDNIHTYEDKGRTIYLYGESNATWISGGIWYDIKGDAKLNSDQLIRIATSM